MQILYPQIARLLVFTGFPQLPARPESDNIMFKTILKLIGLLFLLSPLKSSPTIIFETSTYTVIFEIFDFGDLEKFIIILSLCPFLALDPRAKREDDNK